MGKTILASLLLLATDISLASADEPNQDPSTWRWTTAMAIDAQRGPDSSSLAARNAFIQRYERYSYNGQVEAPR